MVDSTDHDPSSHDLVWHDAEEPSAVLLSPAYPGPSP